MCPVFVRNEYGKKKREVLAAAIRHHARKRLPWVKSLAPLWNEQENLLRKWIHLSILACGHKIFKSCKYPSVVVPPLRYQFILSTSNLLIMVSSWSLPKENVLWQLYFYHKKINLHCSLYVAYMLLLILINTKQPSQVWWTWYYWTYQEYVLIMQKTRSPYPIPWLNKHCTLSFCNHCLSLTN